MQYGEGPCEPEVISILGCFSENSQTASSAYFFSAIYVANGSASGAVACSSVIEAQAMVQSINHIIHRQNGSRHTLITSTGTRHLLGIADSDNAADINELVDPSLLRLAQDVQASLDGGLQIVRNLHFMMHFMNAYPESLFRSKSTRKRSGGMNDAADTYMQHNSQSSADTVSIIRIPLRAEEKSPAIRSSIPTASNLSL